MWASPETRLTYRSSGLPQNRRVSAYCFAPPCVVSPRLSAKAAASGLIVSFVYGHDIVSRLSLGSVRDLTRAAVWLCAAENKGGDKVDGYGNITKKAFKWKLGRGDEGDEEWVSDLCFLNTSVCLGLIIWDSLLLFGRRLKRTCIWQTYSLPAVSCGHYEMATWIVHIDLEWAPVAHCRGTRSGCSKL